jgi:transcriptional regulator with XRE-family HTH domain
MSAEQIRAAMADRGIKIKDVAKATGLSRGTIYRFLKGEAEAHPSTLVLLEGYLKGVIRG